MRSRIVAIVGLGSILALFNACGDSTDGGSGGASSVGGAGGTTSGGSSGTTSGGSSGTTSGGGAPAGGAAGAGGVNGAGGAGGVAGSTTADAGLDAHGDSAIDVGTDVELDAPPGSIPCGSGSCPPTTTCWCTDPVVCCPKGALCIQCPN